MDELDRRGEGNTVSLSQRQLSESCRVVENHTFTGWGHFGQFVRRRESSVFADGSLRW